MLVVKSVITFRLLVFHGFKSDFQQRLPSVCFPFPMFEFIVIKNDKHTVQVSEEASTEEGTSIHVVFFVIKSRPCHIHAFEEASA